MLPRQPHNSKTRHPMNRTSIILATFASFALTACSAADDLDLLSNAPADSNAITFRVSQPDYKVVALDGSSSYSGTTWPTGRPSDWQGLTFVAYVDQNPTRNSFRLSDGEASFADYQLPTDAGQHTDLLYAVAKDVKKESADGNVSLQFRSALSQISFVIDPHSMGSDMEILSIELGGVAGKGTYRFPQESTDGGAAGEWTLAAEAGDACFRIENPEAGEENMMMIIPQKTDAYIKVRIKTTEHGDPDGVLISEEVIPISTDWKEGQHYSYYLAYDATLIQFDVNISDFTDVNIDADL